MILPNNSLTSGDCTVFPHVCTQIKAFKTAQLNITVYKNKLMIFQGNHNICKKTKNPRNIAIELAMIFFGIPNKCPCDQNTLLCSDERSKINITAFRRIFDVIVGSIKVEATVETDIGKSCFVGEGDLVKE